MIRVSLTNNIPQNRPKALHTGMIELDYDALVKFAHNKMKIPLKKIRLFIAKPSPNLYADPGTEIKLGQDLSKILADGVILAVSKENDYLSKNSNNFEDINILIKRIGYPPRHPYPSLNQRNQKEKNNIVIEYQTSSKPPKLCKTLSKQYDGNFSIMDGNLIDSLRQITSRNEYVIKKEGDGFNSYDYEDHSYTKLTFHDQWLNSLLYECRGLIVSPTTGMILARRFHYFAKPECLNQEKSNVVMIQEKIDGSMVSPVLLENGKLIWVGRRDQINDPELKEFLDTNLIYNTFSEKYLAKGITPIFERCSTDHIVGIIQHKTPQIYLLALRDNISGKYYDLDLENIPIGIKLPTRFDTKFKVQDVSKWINKEGIVITYSNGSKIKCKSDWYKTLSQATKSNHFINHVLKDRGSLEDVPEIYIWRYLIKKPKISYELFKSDLERDKYIDLVSYFNSSLNSLKRDFLHWTKGEKREHLVKLLQKVGWDTSNFQTNIDDFIKKNINYLTNTRDLDQMKEVLDLELNGNLFVETQFETCLVPASVKNKIKDHVLDQYLPKKISHYLGSKKEDIHNDTIVKIPYDYTSDEGRIKGYWEQFIDDGIQHLRIDLQVGLKGKYNGHYGNLEYALLLLQYGEDPSTETGIAGVLIPTNFEVQYRNIKKGFELSFKNSKIIRLRRDFSLVYNQEKHIYCDLDGVLADFEKKAEEVLGHRVSNLNLGGQQWQKILSYHKFFRSLDWMSGAEQLWKKITEYLPRKQISILTGIPKSSKKDCSKDKKAWCNEKLGKDIQVITCFTSQKYQHSQRGAVLIDDNYKTKKQWEMYGGKFVFHFTIPRTLYELDMIFNNREFQKNKIKITKHKDAKEYSHNRQVIWVNSEEELDLGSEKVIALDFEWNPYNEHEPVCIGQIATKDKIFLVDLMTIASVVIKDKFYYILEDPEILKITFASEGDIQRIDSDIVNLVDLRELIQEKFIYNWRGLSLKELAEVFSGIKIKKDKQTQTSKWDQRPLSIEQIEYASDDPAIIYDIYHDSKMITIPGKKLFNQKKSYENLNQKTTKSNESNGRYLTQLSDTRKFKAVELVASLSISSKQQLSGIFGNRYGLAKHYITLLKNPSLFDFRNYSHIKHNHPDKHTHNVGSSLIIKTVGYYDLITSKIIKFYLGDPDRYYYIEVINTFEKGSRKTFEIDQLDPKDEIELKLELKGSFGVLIKEIKSKYDDLAVLETKIKDQIIDFQQNASIGSKISLLGLTPRQRSVIHQFSSENGISSLTNKTRDGKKIILKKIRNSEEKDDSKIYSHASKIKDSDDDYRSNCQVVIDDPNLFDSLNIVFQNSDRQLQIENQYQITENTIDPVPPELTNLKEDDKVFIILRGLPGSGKTHLSNILKNNILPKNSSRIVSADQYFTNKDGEYIYDSKKIKEAHQYCFDSANEAIILNIPFIIVDNTNISVSSYDKYLDLATQNQYDVIVIEIVVNDRDLAKEVISRSVHNIPIKDGLRMFNTWEDQNENKKLIQVKPYQKNKQKQVLDSDNTVYNLEKWIQDNHIRHFNNKRRATHLSMAIGNQTASFLDVPYNLMHEFLEVYWYSDSPRYLVEMIHDGMKFKMFLDFDHLGQEELKKEEIENICDIIVKFIKTKCYVTGLSSLTEKGYKTGLHFRFPDLIVNQREALTIRNNLVKYLTKLDNIPKTDWEHVIDHSIYGNKRGLRMFKSRKATKTKDVDRVHQLLYTYDSNCKKVELKDEYDWTIMKELSILV